MIGAPSRLRLIRKAAALARIDETRDLSIEEKAARRKWKNAPIFDCADSTLKLPSTLKLFSFLFPRAIKVKAEGSTRLVYRWLCGGLEPLKIETRLIDERFASVMGECVI